MSDGVTHNRGAGSEHTDVHDRGSRLLELLQDAVVVLLNVTLLGIGLVFLYRVWAEIVADGDLQRGLSNIIFVVITIELYRLWVYYLRYHRVNLNIIVEVGVSAIIQKVILVGIDDFSMQQLLGISLILLALGAVLWVHTREDRLAAPGFAAAEDRELQGAGAPRDGRVGG